jgi:prepilin-type N-terminal cleavage/methylation domain-containing protein
MMKKIWERRDAEGGFTLIELLIVIVILGVLAAVAVFALSGSSADSKKAACKSDVATVQTAADAYYAKNGSQAGTSDATGIAALVTAGYLRSAPSSTAYTITYTYATGAVGSSPACNSVT